MGDQNLSSDAVAGAVALTHRPGIIRAMRIVLVLVAVFAIFATADAIYLSVHVLPQLNTLKQNAVQLKAEADGQAQMNQQLKQELTDFCDQVVTSQNHGPDSNTARTLDTLHKCEAFSPQDHALVNYEADVDLHTYAATYTAPHAGAGFQAVLNVTAKSLGIKPNFMAYEDQGLAYCLKAKSTQPDDAADRAVQSFQKVFEMKPGRKLTLQQREEFSDYCPTNVQKLLYP
jgi:hypothetical protein